MKTKNFTLLDTFRLEVGTRGKDGRGGPLAGKIDIISPGHPYVGVLFEGASKYAVIPIDWLSPEAELEVKCP